MGRYSRFETGFYGFILYQDLREYFYKLFLCFVKLSLTLIITNYTKYRCEFINRDIKFVLPGPNSMLFTNMTRFDVSLIVFPVAKTKPRTIHYTSGEKIST